MSKYNLDVVIPVLMPSEYLPQMRNHLATINSNVRINYVLDFMFCKKSEQKPINNLRANERIITGKFGSPGFARNEALTLCDSKFICFWDVDDCPDVERASSFLKQFTGSNADIGIGSWNYVDKPSRKHGTSVTEVGTSPGIWRFLFKKEFLERFEFSDLKWGEDQLFLMEVFSREPKILTSGEIIYRYRQNTPGSLTSQKRHVMDLFECLKRGVKSFVLSERNYRKCCGIMLLRQVFSLYKYGGFFLGSKAFIYLIFSTRAMILNPAVFVRTTTKGMGW